MPRIPDHLKSQLDQNQALIDEVLVAIEKEIAAGRYGPFTVVFPSRRSASLNRQYYSGGPASIRDRTVRDRILTIELVHAVEVADVDILSVREVQ